MISSRRPLAPLALLATGWLSGCGGDAPTAPTDPALTVPPATTATQPTTAARPPRPRPARCPAAAAPGCRTASGRIAYVERVDPDGDGDAHFVLLSEDSITAPGISVIDVRRALRPHPLPAQGDRISAAGPVYTGSYGQRQVEAIVLNVSR